APAATDRLRAQVQNIFAPVALPVNRIAALMSARFSHSLPRDDGSPKIPRTSAEIIVENQQLRVQIASLQGQLNRLQERDAERARFGDLRNFCTLFNVIGGDGGQRDSIMLSASSLDGLQTNMPVLYAGGLAGRISRVGVGGAQVMLVTDPQCRVTAVFGRFIKTAQGKTEFQKLSSEPNLAQGVGHGLLIARIATKMVSDLTLTIGDSVLLSDNDWPAQLDGYRIGNIDALTASRDPGFMDVKIKPEQDLMGLREVMVMNKEKG
ncbi:MAG TPA: rod shape-determining protein MreC, partial [Tepidisphaeraceae bacterium]|nr:rod shape-determining protein MreC [Tepidisphaeraceae bacterium]